MSNKNFLDGLPLLIECLDIPDDIKDKIWEVYHRYENETNPQKQADALIRIQSLIRRADKIQKEGFQKVVSKILDKQKSSQSIGLDISYENESPGLQWLKAIYSQEEESTELSEFEMDNDSNHASWHLTIRETKIKVEGEETEIGAQVRCLKKLYQKLKKDNCIEEQSEKDEAIFIYRFSGITTGSDMPWGVENKIKWKGKNVLLGHIVRCLTSDKNNPPMDLSTAASFFISATGKPMNLATAQYQEVDPDIKFKDQKKILDHNFVEAVEILQECGFVNTMITSSRKRQKNKTDF